MSKSKWREIDLCFWCCHCIFTGERNVAEPNRNEWTAQRSPFEISFFDRWARITTRFTISVICFVFLATSANPVLFTAGSSLLHGLTDFFVSWCGNEEDTPIVPSQVHHAEKELK